MQPSGGKHPLPFIKGGSGGDFPKIGQVGGSRFIFLEIGGEYKGLQLAGGLDFKMGTVIGDLVSLFN